MINCEICGKPTDAPEDVYKTHVFVTCDNPACAEEIDKSLEETIKRAKAKNWTYDAASDAHMYGTQNDGCGVFFDKSWCCNVSCSGELHFFDKFESLDVAKEHALKYLNKLRELQ